jgi:hypothetical protein
MSLGAQPAGNLQCRAQIITITQSQCTAHVTIDRNVAESIDLTRDIINEPRAIARTHLV